MGAYPKAYDKKNFIEFLHEQNVPVEEIEKLESLPESIESNNSKYKLNIIATWYSVGETFWNFELNYYSGERIEFLFPYEIKRNVVESINRLYELINGLVSK